MAETNYEIIGRKLKVLDPDKFKELNDPPILSDISLVPQIITEIACYAFQCHFTKENITIAVILKLYDPDVLNGWKRRSTINGLRDLLAKHLTLSANNISHLNLKVRNYYLIYKKYHDEVDYIASEIGQKYKCKCFDN